MKKIIVATDFSDAALNAANYSLQFAQINKSEILLLHVYHVPMPATEVPIIITSLDDIEKDCLENLQNLKNKLVQQNNDVKIVVKCVCGFALDEINQAIVEEKADLLIVGMQGAGVIAEKLMGSIATSLIKNAKCPVLTIGSQIKYKNINRILLATDYNAIGNKNILQPLKSLIEKCKAKLLLLNVVKELKAVPTIDEAGEGLVLDNFFGEINHDFHTVQNNDVISGINQFANENNIDMLVMIPRKHNFLWNMFNEANTKKMAFHTNMPLLTLHE